MQNTEELFQKYKDDVYRLALSYTKSTQEAEDICQTTFLKLLEQRTIAPGKEKAWLMQVTANQCRNLLRSCWWKRTDSLEDASNAALSQDNFVLHAVMALPPKYRVVLYLRYYEEYSTKEMAQILRISQSTVTTRLSRARQMLKDQLQEVSI